MRATIRKWGNSASIRIPAAVMEAANLYVDQPVDVREEEGRVVIEPLGKREYDLNELVNGITPDNLHDPVEAGGPIGKEVW